MESVRSDNPYWNSGENAEVKMLKTELHQRTLSMERRQELHARLTTLEPIIVEQKPCLKAKEDQVKKLQEEQAVLKARLVICE